MITNNPAFPSPSPKIAEFATAVDDLDTKTQAAMNRGRIEIAARRASQRSVLSLTRQLASYVQMNCNNNLETLLASGFDAIRARSPAVVPRTPTDPRLEYNGICYQRHAIFRFGGDSNSRNFSVQHSENAAGPWTDHALSTSTRVRIEDLTPASVLGAQPRQWRRRLERLDGADVEDGGVSGY